MVYRIQCSYPPEMFFAPHFLRIVVEVKVSGLPHVLEPWFGVNQGMVTVEYCRSNKSFFVSVECHGHHSTVTTLRCICPPPPFGILTDLRQQRLCGVSKRSLALTEFHSAIGYFKC